MSKICKTRNKKGCGLEKKLTEFNFRKDINKYISVCKKCEYKKAKERRNNRTLEQKNKRKKEKKLNSYTLTSRYYQSKRGATDRSRNYCYELTKEDYNKLTTNQYCIYCGYQDGPEDTKYVGVDRVCNSIGYKIGNVVPCCKTCNVAKAGMSYNQFINMCNRISKIHNNKY